MEANKTTFNNEIAGGLVEILLANATEFERRRKGGTLKAMLFAIADAFPEDRANVQGLIGRKAEAKDSGGAKIHRGGTSGKDVIRGGCEGCTPVPVVASNKKVARIVNPADKPFESADDVLERFEGKAPAMQAFAQSQEIEIGDIKSAKKIAEIIYNYYNPTGE